MAPLNVQQTATWVSGGSALSLTHTAHSQLARSPSTSSARVCWAAAMMISLHQISKDLLSLTLSPICTQQGNSIKGWLSLLHTHSKDLLSLPWIIMYRTRTQQMTAESDSQTHSSGTQQMMAESDSRTHSSGTQQKKMAESGSPHTHSSETQWRRWLSMALHTPTRLRDSAKKVT